MYKQLVNILHEEDRQEIALQDPWFLQVLRVCPHLRRGPRHLLTGQLNRGQATC